MLHWEINNLQQSRKLSLEPSPRHHHEGHFIGQDLVQGLTVIAQGHSAVRGNVVYINFLVYIHHKLPLWMNIDHHLLLLVHGLHHLPHISALLLQVLQLLPHHAQLGLDSPDILPLKFV